LNFAVRGFGTSKYSMENGLEKESTDHSEHCFDGMDDRTAKLAEDLVNGSRVALSKSITMVESKLVQHHVQARHLLAYLAKLKPANELKPSFRVGISGPPGMYN